MQGQQFSRPYSVTYTSTGSDFAKTRTDTNRTSFDLYLTQQAQIQRVQVILRTQFGGFFAVCTVILVNFRLLLSVQFTAMLLH